MTEAPPDRQFHSPRQMRSKLLETFPPLFSYPGRQDTWHHPSPPPAKPQRLNQSFQIILALKFDEFWTLLSQELATPRQFATQSKGFSAKYSGGRLLVSTSDDSVWTIDRSTVRQVWSKAVTLHESARFNHASYSHDNIRTSSFILSVMKAFLSDKKME